MAQGNYTRIFALHLNWWMPLLPMLMANMNM